MFCLSWRREGAKGYTVVANPIYPLSDLAQPLLERIDFEIVEADAGTLFEHVGESHIFYWGDEIGLFRGKIGPLVPAVSTWPGLALLRHKPSLRGYIDIVDRDIGPHDPR